MTGFGLWEPGHCVFPLGAVVSPAAHCPHSCLPPRLRKAPGSQIRKKWRLSSTLHEERRRAKGRANEEA